MADTRDEHLHWVTLGLLEGYFGVNLGLFCGSFGYIGKLIFFFLSYLYILLFIGQKTWLDNHSPPFDGRHA